MLLPGSPGSSPIFWGVRSLLFTTRENIASLSPQHSRSPPPRWLRVEVHRIHTLALLWAAGVAKTLVTTEPSPIHLPVAIAISLLPVGVGDNPGTVLCSQRQLSVIYPGEFSWAVLSCPGAVLCSPGTVLHPPWTTFHSSGLGDPPGTVFCHTKPQERPHIT